VRHSTITARGPASKPDARRHPSERGVPCSKTFACPAFWIERRGLANCRQSKVMACGWTPCSPASLTRTGRLKREVLQLLLLTASGSILQVQYSMFPLPGDRTGHRSYVCPGPSLGTPGIGSPQGVAARNRPRLGGGNG
jgi:hypothetical protein